MTDRDGGPAFPMQPVDADGLPTFEFSIGMSLRNWLAGQAIAGTLPGAKMTDAEVAELARWAYRMADAVLAAGNRSEPVEGE